MIQNINLTFGRQGMNAPISQVQDYVERGPELAAFPLIFFVADTYEERIKERQEKQQPQQVDEEEAGEEDDVPDQPGEETRDEVEPNDEGDAENEDFVERMGAKRRRGRRPNQRCRYLEGHPRCESHQRVLRTPGHNTIPKTVGAFYPSHDDPDRRDFFFASMLAICKPWRQLADLKQDDETWEAAYDTFMASAPKRIHHIVSGIKYHYECRRSAAKRRIVPEDGSQRAETRRVRSEFDEIVEAVQDEESDDEMDEDEADRAQRELAQALDEEQNSREEVYGKAALAAAKTCHVLRDTEGEWEVSGSRAGVATGDDMMNLERWQHALQASLTAMEPGPIVAGDADAGTVSMDDGLQESVQYIPPDNMGVGETQLTAVEPSCLFPEQRRAYDIVDWHLNQTLHGKNPEQLLMHIPGEGGVGKSKVIQTITERFKELGVEEKLVKGAYTGIAASLIGGRTLHTLAKIPLREGKEGKRNPRTERQLAKIWDKRSYLIIDEVSMVPLTMMTQLSQRIGRARAHLPDYSSTKPFGGLNVILLGDMHQFPPVIGGVQKALFLPMQRCRTDGKNSEAMVKGREIYEQFDTVVKLRKQVRVVDEEWRNLLQRVRHGNCGANELRYLRRVVLSDKDCPPTDFSQEHWKNATLITPRHSVRRLYNSAKVREHCEDTKTTLYISPAEDLINGRELTAKEKLAVLGLKRTPLPATCEIAIGAQVMVTFNVETELDIANGSRGVVHGIVLDEREPDSEGSVVHLKYPPAYILVKLDRTKAPRLAGLPEGVVPIKPMTKDMTISVNGRPVRVSRTSLPMTLAYALTDYRAQGQTLKYVIVDIAWPPSGGLTPFNVYVALSRSSGADTIRLLRDFDPTLFTKHPSEYLRQEDKRLEHLDRETKVRWDAVFARSVGSASVNKAY